MTKAPLLTLLAVAVLTLAAGCASSRTARTKQRYYTPAGSFSDTSERSTFVDRRTAELVKQGMKPEDAAGRASREWFSHAGVATEQPTKAELKRRAAEADLVNFLEKEKGDRSR
ncbi:MAG TPA: hypothetical protein VG734_12330 [Lacunisphaera sp.]|nr:hypothetical protein [Lacunisphaera sp.]